MNLSGKNKTGIKKKKRTLPLRGPIVPGRPTYSPGTAQVVSHMAGHCQVGPRGRVIPNLRSVLTEARRNRADSAERRARTLYAAMSTAEIGRISC
jgi:hypothetical protein